MKTSYVRDGFIEKNIKQNTGIYSPMKGLSSSYVVVQAPILFIILCFCLINFITIYVFLFKPFAWNDGNIARFMY